MLQIGTKPAALAAVMLGLAIWTYYILVIGVGGLSHYDEFYTLDRSAGFALHGDWLTVYSAGEPTFKKPPLQYWMSGLFLELGLSETVALRLPSMLFVLGSFAATGLLVYAIAPSFPLAIPAAVLVLASSGALWQNATMALLDSGAAFFTTLSLAMIVLSLRSPKYWFITAIVIGLGAWQKAPVPLVLFGLFVLMLKYSDTFTSFNSTAMRADPRFKRAVKSAILLSFIWPIFQIALHGPEVLQKAIGSQMIDRFTPFGSERAGRNWVEMSNLLIDGEWVLRGLGSLALLALPFVSKRREIWPLSGILLIYVLAMCLAGGQVYPRYSLLFEPLLAASIVIVLAHLMRHSLVYTVATLVISGLALGPIKPAESLGLSSRATAQMSVSISQSIAKELKPDELFILCRMDRKKAIYPGAAAYYATPGRNFLRPSSREKLIKEREETEHRGPLRGACRPDELSQISDLLEGLEHVEMLSGYVHWRADGWAQPTPSN